MVVLFCQILGKIWILRVLSSDRRNPGEGCRIGRCSALRSRLMNRQCDLAVIRKCDWIDWTK